MPKNSVNFRTLTPCFTFKGAGIKRKSHIQIAVRSPHAVIGYFRPKGF